MGGGGVWSHHPSRASRVRIDPWAATSLASGDPCRSIRTRCGMAPGARDPLSPRASNHKPSIYVRLERLGGPSPEGRQSLLSDTNAMFGVHTYYNKNTNPHHIRKCRCDSKCYRQWGGNLLGQKTEGGGAHSPCFVENKLVSNTYPPLCPGPLLKHLGSQSWNIA